jgi:hypothetical protein
MGKRELSKDPRKFFLSRYRRQPRIRHRDGQTFSGAILSPRAGRIYKTATWYLFKVASREG